LVDAEKDPETLTHEINILDLGCDPVKVSEGE